MRDDITPEVTYEAGQRHVRWPVHFSDGDVIVDHDFPDALSHHYPPGELNAAVPLYSGTFLRPEDQVPFQGDVRWRWGAIPRIEARGQRASRVEDLKSMFADKDSELWVQHEDLRIDQHEDVLPHAPLSLEGPPSDKGLSITMPVEQQLGNAQGLERVTFLVPNGWSGSHGQGSAIRTT